MSLLQVWLELLFLRCSYADWCTHQLR